MLHKGRIVARGRAGEIGGPGESLEDAFRRLVAAPDKRTVRSAA